MVYTYVCGDDACARRFDEIRTLDERDAPIACPSCGAAARRDPWGRPPHVFLPDQEIRLNQGDLSAHRRWFHSPETQARLRSGELVQARRPRTPYGWEDV